MKSNRHWQFKALKSRLRRKLLHIFGQKVRAVLVSGKEGYFVVDPADAHVSRQLLENGSYNPVEVSEILKFIDSETKILILGGHIGTLVVPLAKVAKEVCVVEANPATFELLNLNMKLNSISNVRLFNLAANDKPGKLQFLNNTENSGGSKRLPINKRANYFYDNPQILEVPAVSLDDVFPNEIFDVILMDIEGSEYFAIKGMPNLIKRCRTFVFEFFPDHLNYVSGVSVDDFYDSIPKKVFTKAFLPQQNRKCSFDDLRSELIALQKDNKHEDGIFLLK
jgi:FkbM family methyltransferase